MRFRHIHSTETACHESAAAASLRIRVHADGLASSGLKGRPQKINCQVRTLRSMISALHRPGRWGDIHGVARFRSDHEGRQAMKDLVKEVYGRRSILGMLAGDPAHGVKECAPRILDQLLLKGGQASTQARADMSAEHAAISPPLPDDPSVCGQPRPLGVDEVQPRACLEHTKYGYAPTPPAAPVTTISSPANDFMSWALRRLREGR